MITPSPNDADFRPLMFSIAYRMTGSVAEAEDLVQEAFFRLERARQSGVVVESPKVYLVAGTTRLAIDHLRSARGHRPLAAVVVLAARLARGRPGPARRPHRSASLSFSSVVVTPRVRRAACNWGVDVLGAP
jgi:DNA-directed RNA polymerase specialized sigma24 family protein